MAEALRRAGPAIVASGLTVIAALLCLTIADVEGTAGLGPIGATGIAIAMISMLTLLPATLVIAGRWAFWPFVPHVGDQQGRRDPRCLAPDRREHRPRPAPGLDRHRRRPPDDDAGLAQPRHRPDPDEQLPRRRRVGRAARSCSPSRSRRARALPPTRSSPTPRRSPAVAEALAKQDAVEDVRLGQDAGRPGQELQVILADDPYATSTYDQIPALREVAKEAGGEDVLLGGPTAIERDLRVAAARDSKLIPPIALAVVLPDPDRPAPGAGRAAGPDRNRDPLLRGGPRRRLHRLRRHLRLRRAATRRCPCSRSSSWSPWASTTTSS